MFHISARGFGWERFGESKAARERRSPKAGALTRPLGFGEVFGVRRPCGAFKSQRHNEDFSDGFGKVSV